MDILSWKPRVTANCFGFILLLGALLLPVTAWAAQSGFVAEVDSLEYHVRIAEDALYLEDKSSELTIEDLISGKQPVSFNRHVHNSLHFGFSESTYWLRIPVNNRLPTPVLLSLDLQYPLLDEVDFYRVKDGQVIDSLITGDKRALENRAIRLKNFVYPFEMAQGENVDIYVRVKSKSTLFLPMHLSSENQFVESLTIDRTIDGLYFGVACGLLIYNLLLFFMIRERIYLEYSYFVLSHIIYIFCLSGYPQVFASESEFITQRGVYLFGIISGLCLFQFSRTYLQTGIGLPKFDLVLRGFMAALVAAAFFIMHGPLSSAIKLTFILVMVSTTLLFVVAVVRYRQGFAPALYFVIGQGAILVSFLFTALASENILPLYNMAEYVVKIANVFELLFFSIGLADRINHERSLRENAQQEAAAAQQRLLEAQAATNEKLDLLVRQRTEELEHANKKLAELNRTDELTGLRNRRHLNDAFPQAFRSAYREKKPIAAMILDIDHFKKLNDTYGHQFGDLCLEATGNIIDKNMRRPYDMAFRYGGEEFVMILPNTDHAGAMIVAEKIRSDIEAHVVSDETHTTSMTASIGMVSIVPSGSDDHETLLKTADELLYQAKEQGRNRIVSNG